MNYKKIYDSLIDRARTRKITGYSERHHIIPKCMGGTNDALNLVRLTPEEHFLCHQLLCRIYKGTEFHTKMVFAVKMMTIPNSKNQSRNVSKLKMFSWLRTQYSKAVSTTKSGKPGSMLGKKSPWTSERNRLTKGSKRTFNQAHRENHLAAISKPRSEDTKLKISKTKTGIPRKRLQCPHCGKDSGEGNYSRWHGDNCRSITTNL